MTGSMLAYIPAAKVDLTGPIPQILAAAFGGGSAGGGIDWGLMLGRATILVLARRAGGAVSRSSWRKPAACPWWRVGTA